MEKNDIDRILLEQQLNKKNWFSENIPGLIAVAFTIFTFAVYIIVLSRVVHTTETTTTVILTSVTNMEMLILGFYFVSSKSNKDKDKQLIEKDKQIGEMKEEAKTQTG